MAALGKPCVMLFALHEITPAVSMTAYLLRIKLSMYNRYFLIASLLAYVLKWACHLLLCTRDLIGYCNEATIGSWYIHYQCILHSIYFYILHPTLYKNRSAVSELMCFTTCIRHACLLNVSGSLLCHFLSSWLFYTDSIVLKVNGVYIKYNHLGTVGSTLVGCRYFSSLDYVIAKAWIWATFLFLENVILTKIHV